MYAPEAAVAVPPKQNITPVKPYAAPRGAPNRASLLRSTSPFKSKVDGFQSSPGFLRNNIYGYSQRQPESRRFFAQRRGARRKSRENGSGEPYPIVHGAAFHYCCGRLNRRRSLFWKRRQSAKCALSTQYPTAF